MSMQSRRTRWAGTVALAVVLTFAAGARAGGLFYPDLGAVALGRGSAFAVKADNLSAFYYNPAGLSKSKGVNVLLGGSLNDLNVDFLRSGVSEGEDPWFSPTSRHEDWGLTVANPGLDYSEGVENPRPFDTVSQETAVIINSVTVIASWGDAFDVEGLAIAAGGFAPSGYTKHKYSTGGPQRYAVRELNSLIFYPGVGLSYAFNQYFQIGAVFLSGMAFLEKKQASRLNPAGLDTHFNEDAGGDASLALDFDDLFMPTGIIGVLSQPLDWLELGVSVRLPVFMEASGNVKYTAPEDDYPDARAEPGHHSVVVSHHFPTVVTAGVRYINRYFDVEADFVWENWGSYDGMEADLDLHVDLDGDETTDPNVIPDSFIPKHFRDTYSVRLGSDVQVWPEMFTVRLGGLYQSSAYPENHDTFSLDFPYSEQFGLSFGLTWHAFGWVDVSFGYSHLFQPRVTVEDGILQQSAGSPAIDPDDGELIHLGNTVNNGTYDVNLNIFALSLEGHF